MGTEQQKEFFNEFTEEKGKFKKITDSVTRRQPKFYIHLALENIVFAIIIVIMCVIIAFALGVERGKRLTLPVTPQEEEVVVIPEKEIPVAKEITPEKPKITPYTIQLISYRERSLAEKELEKLSAKKIDAFIVPAGRWFRVSAGSYGDMEEAKEALGKFSKEYNGCFIRKR